MSLIEAVRERLPVKYREMAKFLVVGGISYVVDVGLFSLMSHTVLENKVVTAKAISILVATIVSYVLNREWSFSRWPSCCSRPRTIPSACMSSGQWA